MFGRKGQGLSMNVIIIAAIALLILVILSVLILRAGRETSEGTGHCAALDGAYCDIECEPGYFHERSRDDLKGGCGEDEICCAPLQND